MQHSDQPHQPILVRHAVLQRGRKRDVLATAFAGPSSSARPFMGNENPVHIGVPGEVEPPFPLSGPLPDAGRIKLYSIPTRSPHLEPIERLWALMHSHITHNPCHSAFHEIGGAMLTFLRIEVLRSRHR
jgi:hypothetical protein